MAALAERVPVAERNADRTTWDDPHETLARCCRPVGARGAPSLMAAGELPPPPIAQTLGFGGIEVEEGRVTFEVEPAEFHYNPIGVVHGGLALALLDSAMGCAVHSTLPAGVALHDARGEGELRAPADGLDTGLVRCTGTVVHAGRTVATAEGSHRGRRRQAVRPRHQHAARSFGA